MPRKPSRPCSYPGCPQLVTVDGPSYCITHSRQLHRAYQAQRSDGEEQRFYRSSRWRQLRNWQLRQEPSCAGCGEPATEVDHRLPLRHGGEPLAVDNLQSLCRSCHQRKSARERST